MPDPSPIFAGDAQAVKDLAKLVAKGKVDTWYIVYMTDDGMLMRAGACDSGPELLGVMHWATKEIAEAIG